MTSATPNTYRIDGLQYCNWSEKIFRQVREGGVDAIHVTVAYHEDFRETVERIIDWNRRFEQFAELIVIGRRASDIDLAKASGRTAVFLGLQNCSPIEDDIGLVQVLHDLGVRVMQLTYNNQSLLGSGYAEAEDGGVTRMGAEVIAEMNRLGLIIDLSHSAERTSLQAIDLSARPVTISHANPRFWHDVPRNKSNAVLEALAERRGMLGFSLYPLHLAGGSACTLESFCQMVARTADLIGVDRLGIGSDLCQDQPNAVLGWMRSGRWTKQTVGTPEFPPQPGWFRDSRDFQGIEDGLVRIGFTVGDTAKIMGGNWYRFLAESFGS